jgi:hypothetical protein
LHTVSLCVPEPNPLVTHTANLWCA